MSNLLTRANLSKLETITNPTRSPEEIKNDDFEGDVISVFQYKMEKCEKELENSEMWLTFGNQPHKFNLYMTKLPDTKINVFFIKNSVYFFIGHRT